MGNYETNGMVYTIRKDGRRNHQNGCDECGTWNENAGGCDAYDWQHSDNDCYECGRKERNNAAAVGNDCECDVCAASGAAVRADCHGTYDGETHVYFESCDGAKEVTLSSECHNEDSLGRVLDVTMTLCNVCPGRRCAVGMHLTEMDEGGNEVQRGFRAITVPAHDGPQNRDLALPSVRFILPEDVSCGGRRRHFVVRTTNHYMDEPTCGWMN